MCCKITYHYVLVLNRIKTPELKSKIVNISKDCLCPDKLLESNPNIRNTKVIYRFYRNKIDKYPVFLNKKYDNVNFASRANEYTLCLTCGLSVYLNLNDLIDTIKEKFPRARNYKILYAEFSSKDGRLYKTGEKSHHTFFPFKNFDHNTYFKVLKEKEEI